MFYRNEHYMSISHGHIRVSDYVTIVPSTFYESLTIRLNISRLFAFNLDIKQFYFINIQEPIRCYHSEPELTLER